MEQQSRLRVGGWVPDVDRTRGGGSAGGEGMAELVTQRSRYATVSADGSSESWQDDEWELAVPVASHGSYRGRRRSRERGPMSWLRLGAAAAMVATLLVGVAALARTLDGEPAPLLAPPPTPEATEPVANEPEATPPSGHARLGEAAAPSAPAAAPPPAPPVPTATPSPTPSPLPAESSPSPSPPASVHYEAEDAELRGSVQVVEMAAADSGAGARIWGYRTSNQVRFHDVVAAEAGIHELTIAYARPSIYPRSWTLHGRVRVNDGSWVAVELPAVRGSRLGSVTIEVELAEGANTIRFGARDSLPGPDLDRITVTGGGG